ncbi:MAG: hypothetical protein WD768_20575 [Phycisphaeraceae bacterium]
MQSTIKIVRIVLTASVTLFAPVAAGDTWIVDTQDEWSAAAAEMEGIEISDGVISPTGNSATFASKVKRLNAKRKIASLMLEQSPIWQNWEPIDNLGPANMEDAPVFLSIRPGNYWAFGRYGKGGKGGRNAPPFKAQPAKLKGFDIPLLTTPWPNQFDAPGDSKRIWAATTPGRAATWSTGCITAPSPRPSPAG